MYQFSNKLLSEAHAIQLKNQFKPESPNRMMQQDHQLHDGAAYMLLSDESDSEDTEAEEEDESKELVPFK